MQRTFIGGSIIIVAEHICANDYDARQIVSARGVSYDDWFIIMACIVDRDIPDVSDYVTSHSRILRRIVHIIIYEEKLKNFLTGKSRFN